MSALVYILRAAQPSSYSSCPHLHAHQYFQPVVFSLKNKISVIISRNISGPDSYSNIHKQARVSRVRDGGGDGGVVPAWCAGHDTPRGSHTYKSVRVTLRP